MSDHAGPPKCPQCGTYVSRKGHTCRARPAVSHTQLLATVDPAKYPPRTPPVTDPAEITARIEECRAALASTSPPSPRPAADLAVYRVADEIILGGDRG